MNSPKGLIFFSLIWGFSLPASPRIITASPALTELLFQLGHGDKIIGASEYSDVPLAAKELPRIGSLFHPSIEKTLHLKPDWILLDVFTLNHSYLQALEALSLKHLSLRIDSVEALFNVSEKLLTEVLKSPPEILNKFRSEVQYLKKHRRPFRFLFLTWADPAIAATRKTFLSSLFETIGGENVVPINIEAPYVPLSKEWMLQSTPDFVFVLHGGDPGKLGGSPKVLPLHPDGFARTNFSGLMALPKIQGEMWK